MKKRGFGAGKWNGVGGKVQEEGVEEAAIREAREEIGVEIKALQKVGLLDFIPMNLRCHVFLVDDWEGEPAESEEMQPKWFAYDEIPYGEMWDDDKVWLPMVLEGKKIQGSLSFDKSDKLVDYKITDL